MANKSQRTSCDGFPLAVRTQAEVAQILTERGEPITKGGVFMAEQRALHKLKQGLREIAEDWFGDEE